MSKTEYEDADWATAAEQSAEEDEAQEGNTLAEAEESVESAEHIAVHVVDDGDVVVDLDAALDALAESIDPEADAIVDDALDIDSADEAEAAAEAVEDEEAEADPYEEFRQDLRFLGRIGAVHAGGLACCLALVEPAA